MLNNVAVKKWLEYVTRIQDGLNDSFEKQWEIYNQIFASETQKHHPPIAWVPSGQQKNKSNLAGLITKHGFADYSALHKWTIENRPDFWKEAIIALDIRFDKEPQQIINSGYDPKDPVWLPGAKMNIVDSCFKNTPDSTAIVYASEENVKVKKISYSELNKMVNRVANGLAENGIKEGARVIIYMPMTTECIAAYLGIIRAGCQVVSVADSFSSDELKKRAEISEASTVICVDSYTRSGKSIDIYSKVRDAGLKKAIVISADKSDRLRTSDIFWEDFLSTKTEFDSVVSDPYMPINILFSSGTTAAPKAIPWNHLTPIKSAMDGHFHQDIHPGDVVAWPTNIGWMMGPWLIFASLINNATIAIYEGAAIGKGFINFIKNAGVTMLGVIPSLVKSWRNDGIPDMDTWDSLRVFSSTGEPSNSQDYLWLMSRTRYKAPIIEYLGGTEIGGGHITGTVLQEASPATFTTPALGIDFILLDSKNKPAESGQSGELYLIPPAVGLSQTILNRNHEEVYYKGCPKGPAGEVLRRHGDQMIRLNDGFYKAQGRADDTMNLGGIKISSIEIEQVAEQHPSVYECAAISVQPLGEGQEKLVLFVHADIPDLKIDQLKKELSQKIAQRINPLFKIYDLKVVKKLPRTASNKLMRRTLRDMYPGEE
ncbi:MAG: AMP-binding protein [Calditrichae bacterium]|nr:AMP-binding protein [Calditrichia bacterium]